MRSKRINRKSNLLVQRIWAHNVWHHIQNDCSIDQKSHDEWQCANKLQSGLLQITMDLSATIIMTNLESLSSRVKNILAGIDNLYSFYETTQTKLQAPWNEMYQSIRSNDLLGYFFALTPWLSDPEQLPGEYLFSRRNAADYSLQGYSYIEN